MLDAAQHGSGFPLVEIGAVVDAVRTTNPAVTAPDDEFIYVDLSAVDQDTKAITAPHRLLGSDAPSRARQVLKRGDVLVSTVRPNLNGVAIVSPDIDGAIGSTGFCVLRPAEGRLDSRYLYHWVRTPAFVEDMVRQATGASYPAVTDSTVRRSRIPAPPLGEQRRIAAILDEADALRAKRRAALAQLDQMAQAIFVEMFGAPLGEKSNGDAVKHVQFEYVAKRITYGFTSPMEHIDAGIPILTAKNILDGRIDLERVHYARRDQYDALSAKSKPKRDDLLITKDGTIGRCAIVDTDQDFCINQSVALVQLDKARVLPSYVAAFIRTSPVQARLRGMGKGNALLHLQITELAKMPIPLPEMAEQKLFEQRQKQLHTASSYAREAAAALNSLFASLQHRAFRGEL